MLKKMIMVIFMGILVILLTIGCTVEVEAYTKDEVDDLIDKAMEGTIKPVAYGTINGIGTVSIESGSANFTLTDNGVGHYRIDVNGVNLDHYDNQVLLGNYDDGDAEMLVYNIPTSYLTVRAFDDAGNAVDTIFSFIIY